MKRMITLMALAIAMMSLSVNTFAQTADKKQRMSRKQLAEAQAKHIAHDLALDDAITQKFIKTFCDYQKDVWALGPRVQGKQTDMSDAEAEQAIKARMERSQKILDLREKYYKEYSKFLTQKQIQRVYELEKQTMKRLGRRGQMGKRPQPGQRPRRSSNHK